MNSKIEIKIVSRAVYWIIFGTFMLNLFLFMDLFISDFQLNIPSVLSIFIDIFWISISIILATSVYEDFTTSIKISSAKRKIEITYPTIINDFLIWTLFVTAVITINNLLGAGKILIALMILIIAYIILVEFEKHISFICVNFEKVVKDTISERRAVKKLKESRKNS